MGLIGRQETTGAFAKLDDISSLFDGSATTFNLTLGGLSFFPSNPLTLLVSVGGVVQEPASAYTIVDNQIQQSTDLLGKTITINDPVIIGDSKYSKETEPIITIIGLPPAGG